jgi:uncharacterized protein YndB with AHSA1/START domain
MTDAATVPTELTAMITIAAEPAQVWSLVSDLTRMREWSPQVVRTVVLPQPVRLGSRMFNLNRQGRKRWPTTGKVVRFAPHRDLAFRITENRTVWSFQLEEADGGTQVTHRREAPQGISALSKVLTKVALGGQEPFVAELQRGMQQTLERIRAAAES